MSMATLIFGRIIRFLHSILGAFKRALCFFSRKKDNIGELPFTVAIAPRHSAPDDPYPSPPIVTGWDSKWDEKAMVEDKIDEWRRKKVENDSPKEQDFFTDMEPEIKKAKKVVLKSKMKPQTSLEKRNLFGFEGDDEIIVPASSQLGELEEVEQAWDDDLDSTLNQHRAEKHRARTEDHERRMKEKRAQRGSVGHY